ncbi:hypothetical protein SAMN04487938_4059 [Lysobacter sp. cf310]|nr:hypothetical protein SAMN04487938_4059 [Lysobacter sp. cf310]
MSDLLTSQLEKEAPPAVRAGVSAIVRPMWAVAAVALLAGGVLYARRGQIAPEAAPEIAATSAEAVAATAARVDRGVGDLDADAPQRTRALTPAQRLRERFEHSDDLYAYAQELGAAVRAGEPESTWMLSRVLDYCAGYAAAPADYGRDTQAIAGMNLRTSEAMVAARNRVGQRCARFTPADDLSYATIQRTRIRAAKAGSLPAEASLLGMDEPLQNDEAYVRDLVDRVRNSLDPEAFFAISPKMGIASSGRRNFYGPIAGTQFSELAWQLAACRLGLDCSPNSVLMTTYCANGGICSQDPNQDFSSFVFDAAVPRQGTEVMNDMVNGLVGGTRITK